jgi:hypothetical protein
MAQLYVGMKLQSMSLCGGGGGIAHCTAQEIVPCELRLKGKGAQDYNEHR